MGAVYDDRGRRRLNREGGARDRSCRALLETGDTAGACNRAYYAMFYAAHAALWAVGVQEPGAVIKTHSGLTSTFGQKLVVTGRADLAHGRALGRVQRVRLLADYTAEPPTEEETRTSIELATTFVAAMRQIVETATP